MSSFLTKDVKTPWYFPFNKFHSKDIAKDTPIVHWHKGCHKTRELLSVSISEGENHEIDIIKK